MKNETTGEGNKLAWYNYLRKTLELKNFLRRKCHLIFN